MNCSPLELVATVELEMEWQESGRTVVSSHCQRKAGVVPDLLGADVVTSVGGIRLQYSNG